jgi:type I restriction enzyme, S subunit
MRSDRVLTTLGEVLTLKRGYDLPQSERKEGDFPIISSSGISGSHSEAKVKAPGVVTGRYGTIGELFYVKEDYWPLNTSLYVENFKGNIPRYIYYFMHSVDVLQLSDKSSVPGVNRNHIHAIEICFERNTDVQRSVAKILGDLDDKIDLLREMNRTLEEISQTLFRAWFVDFVAVRAKAAGAASFRGMPQALFNTLPHAFTHSENGEIPKGWLPCVLSDLIAVNPARAVRKGTPSTYLGMSDVPTGGAFAENWTTREFTSGMRFQNGDTLLARITPCLENGKTALVDFLAEDEIGWGSTEFIVLGPTRATPPEFIYCLARSESFREFAITNMTGTSGRQRVSHEAVSSYPTIDPGGAILEYFGTLVGPMFKRITTNRDEILTLTALRDTVLPELISGELQVPDLATLGLKDANDGS